MYKINNTYVEELTYCKHLRADVIQVSDIANADCIHINGVCIPLDTEIIEFDGAKYIKKLQSRLSIYEEVPLEDEEDQ